MMTQKLPVANSERWTRGSCRGQSLVELAAALSLLLMFLLGTIDLGRMFWAYVELRNAAWQGARYGVTLPQDTAGITARVMNHGVPSNTTVSVSCSNGNCGTITVGSDVTITVTASAPFTPIVTGFVTKYLGIGPFTVRGKATARVST